MYEISFYPELLSWPMNLIGEILGLIPEKPVNIRVL
jgi:hypothetical protein